MGSGGRYSQIYLEEPFYKRFGHLNLTGEYEEKTMEITFEETFKEQKDGKSFGS